MKPIALRESPTRSRHGVRGYLLLVLVLSVWLAIAALVAVARAL